MSFASNSRLSKQQDEMEVDDTQHEEIMNFLVHPLAIVNMADQYTRISLGGSPLERSSPVVGLLLGTVGSSESNKILSITDADDIPTDCSEAASSQILLHQAVFPSHAVVGWYRVSGEALNAGPTAEDLQLTRALREHYYNFTATPATQATPEQSSPPSQLSDLPSLSNPSKLSLQHPFLFALLQVTADGDPTDTSQPSSKAPAASLSCPANHHNQHRQDFQNYQHDFGNPSILNTHDEQDEQLPLTLYRLSTDRQVLVAIEDDWKLHTSVAERIAVERVIREKPSQKSVSNAANADNFLGTKPEHNLNLITSASSKFVQQTTDIQHSVTAIMQRILILENYVQDTISGHIPFHPALMRRIQTVILYQKGLLGPLSMLEDNSTDVNSTTTDVSSNVNFNQMLSSMPTLSSAGLLQQLAILANTVDAVQNYTDKVRAIHDLGHKRQQQQAQQMSGIGPGPTSSYRMRF